MPWDEEQYLSRFLGPVRSRVQLMGLQKCVLPGREEQRIPQKCSAATPHRSALAICTLEEINCKRKRSHELIKEPGKDIQKPGVPTARSPSPHGANSEMLLERVTDALTYQRKLGVMSNRSPPFKISGAGKTTQDCVCNDLILPVN